MINLHILSYETPAEYNGNGRSYNFKVKYINSSYQNFNRFNISQYEFDLNGNEITCEYRQKEIPKIDNRIAIGELPHTLEMAFHRPYQIIFKMFIEGLVK